MRTLRRTATRIWGDIQDGRHLEAYFIAAIAFIFAVVGIKDDVISENLKISAILASLGFLVYNVTRIQPKGLSIDEFLDDRSNFAPLGQRIKGARKLWIYGATAVNVLNGVNAIPIREEVLNHKDAEVLVLVQDPLQTAAVDIVTKQIDENVELRTQRVRESLQATIDLLEDMQKWSFDGKLKYGFVPFSPGFSMFAIDPDKKHGVIIVEFYGYRNRHTLSRMHFELTREKSERWYNYWMQQFEHMWKDARFPTQAATQP